MRYICYDFREILDFISTFLLPSVIHLLNVCKSENLLCYKDNTLPSIIYGIISIIVAIISIIALTKLIIIIMSLKLKICKLLNIGNMKIIICHNRKLKFGRNFLKGCYRSKPSKFQFRDSITHLLSSSNQLVFAHITMIKYLLT